MNIAGNTEILKDIRAIAALAILFFLSCYSDSFADVKNYKQGVTYQYEDKSPGAERGNKIIHLTSGTGFFVSNNNIITNEHVVEGCKDIKIRGAVDPGNAELISVDKINDLALLKTSRIARVVAPLRGDMPVQVGEDVNIIGYPLDRGISGNYLVRKATITSTNDVYEGVERIQFTDSVEKGNSGGPLLDGNGTVIGVVVGRMNFYSTSSDIENARPVKTSSVAITLAHLKKFLQSNKIYYRTDNTIYKFEDSYMENKAREYIVNVQCIKDSVKVSVPSARIPING